MVAEMEDEGVAEEEDVVAGEVVEEEGVYKICVKDFEIFNIKDPSISHTYILTNPTLIIMQRRRTWW